MSGVTGRTHGKVGTYTSGGCRCDLCRAAAQKWRAARKERAEKHHAERADEHRECGVCGATFSRRADEEPARWERRRVCSKRCATDLARPQRWSADPWAVGTRTLLARTCVTCGILRPGDGYPHTGTGNRSRACTTCRGRAYRAGLTGDARDDWLSRASRRGRRINSESQEFAVRSGYQWTGPELELVATRRDLAVAELARMLGRSHAAVASQRQRIQVDPRKSRLAGA